MKVKEVAEYMGVSLATVRRLIKSKKIKSHTQKGLHIYNYSKEVVVIYKDDVDDYLRQLNIATSPATCPHLSHSVNGRCKGCGEQHQILYVPFGNTSAD